jgi:hypothetical protein
MPTCLLPTLEPSPSSSSISNSDDDTTSGHSGPLVAALASFTINASSAVAGTGQVRVPNADESVNRVSEKRSSTKLQLWK